MATARLAWTWLSCPTNALQRKYMCENVAKLVWVTSAGTGWAGLDWPNLAVLSWARLGQTRLGSAEMVLAGLGSTK